MEANNLRGRASECGKQGREVLHLVHELRKEVNACRALDKVLLESISSVTDSVVNCKKRPQIPSISVCVPSAMELCCSAHQEVEMSLSQLTSLQQQARTSTHGFT